METAAPSADTGAATSVPESFSGAEAAARFLVERRNRPAEAAPAAEAETEIPSDDGAEQATAGEHELSDEGNAAQPEEAATGETQADDPADNLPPLEMPRSWTKAQAEHWNALPRPTQEYLIEQASQSSAEVRRVQNEAAEKLKAISAKEQAAEQARATYEQQARAALDILAREQQRDFADIKTAEDVAKLAQTDPLRYIQWDAHQRQVAATKDAVDAADRRKAEQERTEWATFRSSEDAKAKEHIPDLADKAKAPKLMEKAVTLLQDIGFTPEELGKYDRGEKLSLFDHRVQRLIFDGIRYRDLQAAKTAVVTKAVPPVTRPGAKAPQGSANSEKLQALTKTFQNSGSLKDAAALLASRRAAVRRSA